MGSRKGIPNKATLLASYIGTSKDAARLLLRVLEDEDAPMSDRIDAAKTLMPYQHRKLPAAVELSATLQVSEVRRVVIWPGQSS